MLIAAFPAGPLAANCYLVATGPGAECVVVDPGMESAEQIARVVEQHDLTPAGVLVTHGHFDHMWQAADVASSYDVPVWIHPDDRHLLADPMAAISGPSAAMLRAQLGEVPSFREPADVRDAADGTVVDVAGLRIEVDHVPGHTPGTVAYRTDYVGDEPVSQVAFTGDFLFAGSIGRTDLVGGDTDTMAQSLRRFFELPDDVVVLPGHGEQTSIGRERATNPFVLDMVGAGTGTEGS
ncbi:glyoxylase-like metal-dependent hydrolase (beta-lactamase superfamily II) [Mumia flava]|uniref:Glyoxylase-like metal-dependent hydrolase (Beta-lactamase superfamily II) n=1 Tax=Mumia flava TaxID=1348852 RepID=A0A0B2B8Z9_9ACTN|nr:MBL fold metallo-hydrolase [Mumia flava]PJJ55872.1 glyoxylase-like metal-dependent hydrolase (beta-lactamase superfamily II) [Mumia flava]